MRGHSAPRPRRAHLEMIMERGENSGDTRSECSHSPGREEEEDSGGPGHPWGGQQGSSCQAAALVLGGTPDPPLPLAGRTMQLVMV